MVVVELTLEDYYNFIVYMKYYGRFSVDEIDDFYPFERAIYSELVASTIKKINESKQQLA